jgi:hypothetical protein
MLTTVKDNSLETNALKANTLPVPTQVSARQTLTEGHASRRLPYQPNQCAEFLHLQAETEALLQKLYIEQHRRTLCEQQTQTTSV